MKVGKILTAIGAMMGLTATVAHEAKNAVVINDDNAKQMNDAAIQALPVMRPIRGGMFSHPSGAPIPRRELNQRQKRKRMASNPHLRVVR